MDMTPQEYQAYVKKVEPKSPLLKDLLWLLSSAAPSAPWDS